MADPDHRLRSAALPRVLGDAQNLTTNGLSADAAGAVWALDVSQRHLDANIIRLPPDTQIQTHTGPDLDVLMYVLNGDGQLATDADIVPLSSGTLLWLPRRSRRSITAASAGLSYLTVHPRQPALSIEPHRPIGDTTQRTLDQPGQNNTRAHHPSTTPETGPPADAEPRTAPPNPIELLERWQQFGGTWRVLSELRDSITISLCRCDGGEEVQRLTSNDPAILTWLSGRTSSG